MLYEKFRSKSGAVKIANARKANYKCCKHLHLESLQNNAIMLGFVIMFNFLFKHIFGFQSVFVFLLTVSQFLS